MIGIIDYGLGNLQSVHNALTTLGCDSKIIETPEAMADCDRVILPGVGAFGHAMNNLNKGGWSEALHQWAADEKPLLGICLGMQLLAERGLEFGDNEGLSLIPGVINRLESGSLPVPHMGWNSLTHIKTSHPVLAEIQEGQDFYFVHSFAFRTKGDDVLATCEYGESFPAIVGRGSVIGTQFHPEKSQAPGLAILRCFASWNPRG